MRAHLPNALTVLRILLAGVFIAVLSTWDYRSLPLARGGGPAWQLILAAALFAVAAATDALDGHLARRWNVVSAFGRIMDPFADKLLVLGAFVVLAGPGFSTLDPAHDAPRQLSAVQPWMAVLILARELLVTSVRGVLESRGIPFPAMLSGKLKMIVQSAAVPIVLLALALAPQTPVRAAVISWTVWITVALTAWSAIPYIARAAEALRASRPAPTPPSAP